MKVYNARTQEYEIRTPAPIEKLTWQQEEMVGMGGDPKNYTGTNRDSDNFKIRDYKFSNQYYDSPSTDPDYEPGLGLPRR